LGRIPKASGDVCEGERKMPTCYQAIDTVESHVNEKISTWLSVTDLVEGSYKEAWSRFTPALPDTLSPPSQDGLLAFVLDVFTGATEIVIGDKLEDAFEPKSVGTSKEKSFGTLKASGYTALIMFPIATAVSWIVEPARLPNVEKELQDMVAPVPLAGDGYFPLLRHQIREMGLAFQRVVNRFKNALLGKENLRVTPQLVMAVEKELKKSPLFHPPKDYTDWRPSLIPELQRQLFAEWAIQKLKSQLQKMGGLDMDKVKAVIAYQNYTGNHIDKRAEPAYRAELALSRLNLHKTVTAIQALDPRLAATYASTPVSQARVYAELLWRDGNVHQEKSDDGATKNYLVGERFSIEDARTLVVWAEDYRPLRLFGGALPAQVQEFEKEMVWRMPGLIAAQAGIDFSSWKLQSKKNKKRFRPRKRVKAISADPWA
jgi:hypothetical protein